LDRQILRLSEELTELRRTKSDLDAELKFINARIEEVTLALSDAVMEEELPSFTHGGYQYSLTSRKFASAENGDKDALYNALRDNGYEHLFTVNVNTLTSTVRELIDENGGILPDWLVGKARIFEKQSVRVTKK